MRVIANAVLVEFPSLSVQDFGEAFGEGVVKEFFCCAIEFRAKHVTGEISSRTGIWARHFQVNIDVYPLDCDYADRLDPIIVKDGQDINPLIASALEKYFTTREKGVIAHYKKQKEAMQKAYYQRQEKESST